MGPGRSGSGIDLSEQTADFCIDLKEAVPVGIVPGDDCQVDWSGQAVALKPDCLAVEPFDPIPRHRRTVATSDQHGIAELVAGVDIGGKKRPGQLVAFL